MKSQLVLSIFPGLGILDRAFEEQGFCIVRGPDLLWGGDVKLFHPPERVFDGLIGGIPCQAHSGLGYLAWNNGATRAEDLTPEFVRVVEECRPAWWLSENVREAPVPAPRGYGVAAILLNNRDVGGVQSRKRRFCFGLRDREPVNLWKHVEIEALQRAEWCPCVLASGETTNRIRPGLPDELRGKASRYRHKIGSSHATVARALAAHDLPADLFDHSPLTCAGRQRALGNAVPMRVGRALAAMVLSILGEAER